MLTAAEATAQGLAAPAHGRTDAPASDLGLGK